MVRKIRRQHTGIFGNNGHSHSFSFPKDHSHSNFHLQVKGLFIPIPIGIPGDPWELPRVAHLKYSDRTHIRELFGVRSASKNFDETLVFTRDRLI